MSKRMQIQRRLAMLDEVKGIMGAMKNISLMETHKLARFLVHQHRVLASIEAAGGDFLNHYGKFNDSDRSRCGRIIVAIGSQRGFCGDFNEAVIRAIDRYRGSEQSTAHLIIVGRRLASRLNKEQSLNAVLDGPSVVEEVQTVVQQVMNAIAQLHAATRHADPLDVVLIAHREAQVDVRPILPRPLPARRASSVFPPLLNLSPQAFFAELVEHYVWAQVHDAFFSTLMAENRRRLQHMEGAVKRIEEKSGTLRRHYNAVRLEEITEEIEVIMLSKELFATTAEFAQAVR